MIGKQSSIGNSALEKCGLEKSNPPNLSGVDGVDRDDLYLRSVKLSVLGVISKHSFAVRNGSAAVSGVTVPFAYPRTAQAAVEQAIATVWIGFIPPQGR
ncbi:sodium channel protein type 2 subunit alpha [Platysternon megacephalum]|uniref:Sodium channel protein type 2 subunit alpha n=1 Tax=Platysternon megacephalum TaxID=55544 RepID=A0A4D9F2F8_9SAUR|nr:sodium channel protein type 2 subunit alpha [Platysternon megacephalum]